MDFGVMFIWIACCSLGANIAWCIYYIFAKKNIAHDNHQIDFNIQLLELENNRLRSENDYNSHLIRVIAHDFKSPLQNLNSLLDYSTNEFLDEIDKNTALLRLKSATHYADYMLENLLIWADTEQLNNRKSSEIVSVKELISKIVDGLTPLANEKNINLLNCIEDEILVKADFYTLWIVVNNLIVNSIKFSNSGQDIIITALENSGKIQIDIIDFGIGIPESILDKIFLPDLEKNRPGTNYEKGTGIGLILCKRLIESQYGSIRVKSEPDRGSIFSLELPTVEIPVHSTY